MKKAEYKFQKDRQKQINQISKPNETIFYWECPKPIYIPKRKKFK